MKIKSIIYSIHSYFFYTAFYISLIILFLTYDIVLSPDFEKYFNYYKFYDGQIDNTGVEQGHFYFFYSYFFTYLLGKFFSSYSINELVNLSLHFSNSLLFLFGLIGYKNYLLTKEFKKSFVYMGLALMCFLPSSIEMRLNLKPEILAFAFLGWLLYFLLKYKNEKNNKFLYIFTFYLSLLLTSKSSIMLIITLFLLIEIWTNHKELFSLKYKKFYFIVFFICIALVFENANLNGKFLHEVEHAEKYNNKAEIQFITNINKDDLINNPSRYFHYDSFVAITLFDTFSDFFQLYWNSEYTELNKDRRDFFEINRNFDPYRFPKVEYNKSEKFFTIYGNFDPDSKYSRYADFEYTNETRMRGAFKMSIVFYILILIYGLYKKESRNILFSPFLGILIIIISALGVFTNNFDPLIADSVKTFYYSFFISLSFLFLINYLYSTIKFGQKSLTAILFIFFFFFIGFPHSYSLDVKDDLAYKNSLLPTCNINKPILNLFFQTEIDQRCDSSNFIYEIDNKKRKFIPETELPVISKSIKFSRIPFVNIIVFLSIIIFSIKDHVVSYYRKNYE